MLKTQIKKYIEEKLLELKSNSEVKLNNVYPDIIEEVLGNFLEPYSLNGYDCDYIAKTDNYLITGSMRFGTATISLINSINSDETTVEKEIMCDETHNKIPENNKELNIFYFTFGVGQKNQGKFQPIKSESYQKARKKMNELYGIKWAFSYSKNEWDEIPDFLKGESLDLIYA